MRIVDAKLVVFTSSELDILSFEDSFCSLTISFFLSTSVQEIRIKERKKIRNTDFLLVIYFSPIFQGSL